MIPSVRIFQAVYVEVLEMLYFFGVTDRPSGPANLSVEFLSDGKVTRRTQRGVQVIDVGYAGLADDDVTYLDNGYFYGAVIGEESRRYDQINVGYSGSSLLRSKAVSAERWSEQIVLGVRELVSGDLSLQALEELSRSSQLRALALGSLVWLRDNDLRLNEIDDIRAVYIGEALRKSVMKSLAVPILAQGLGRSRGPDDVDYGRRFDLLCDALEYGESSHRICVEDIVNSGESSWATLNLGHYYFGRGEIATADGFYLQAARDLSSKGMRNIHFNNGVFTWRSHGFSKVLDSSPSELRAVKDSLFVGELSDGTDSVSVVHLIGCDDKYFELYGNMCVYSSLCAGPREVLVHVHVCNPSSSTLETLAAWSERRDVRVRYSYEYRSLDEVNVPFYTALRFRVAPDVMDMYHKPIVITDIDMVVDRGWSATCEALEGADAGYISNSLDEWLTEHYVPGARPWDVAAGTMYFSNSEVGQRFLRYVGAYIGAVLDVGSDVPWYESWGIDQVALRKGVDVVLHPSGARVRNLRSLRLMRGPRMDMGGKAELAKEPAPSPRDRLDFGEERVSSRG